MAMVSLRVSASGVAKNATPISRTVCALSSNPMPEGEEVEIGILSGWLALGPLSVRHEISRPVEACEQGLAAPALDEPLADLG